MSVAIDLENDITPVSDFRANAASILEKIRETGRPVVLTQRGRSAAVLLDVRAYQALLEELETLRDIRAGEEDLRAGRTVEHDAARQRLREKYGA